MERAQQCHVQESLLFYQNQAKEAVDSALSASDLIWGL